MTTAPVSNANVSPDSDRAPGAALNWREVDWPRVVRVVHEVRQHYRYSYTAAVTDVKQRLVMVPPDAHDDQRLLHYRLDVRGASGQGFEQTWEADLQGNRVCRVRAPLVERAIDFEAQYLVVRNGTLHGDEPRVDEMGEYLRPTALTAPDARMRDAARKIEAASTHPMERAERANEWAAGAITYQFGVTGVQTPASMALHLGKGVCQDYAHILLGVLRLLDIPARYVSGHLLGEGAPHAWVEAFVPGSPGPVHYDPTHRRRTTLSYIVVAVGRDFSDVTPTSGFFSGAAHGKLSSHKDARVIEVVYADGTRLGAEAMPPNVDGNPREEAPG